MPKLFIVLHLVKSRVSPVTKSMINLNSYLSDTDTRNAVVLEEICSVRRKWVSLDGVKFDLHTDRPNSTGHVWGTYGGKPEQLASNEACYVNVSFFPISI